MKNKKKDEFISLLICTEVATSIIGAILLLPYMISQDESLIGELFLALSSSLFITCVLCMIVMAITLIINKIKIIRGVRQRYDRSQ